MLPTTIRRMLIIFAVLLFLVDKAKACPMDHANGFL